MIRLFSTVLTLPLGNVIAEGVQSPPSTVFDYIKSGGVIAILVIAIYGGFRKEPWWVFGWVYRDSVKKANDRINELAVDIEKWQRIALEGTHIGKQLADAKLVSHKDVTNAESS